MGTCRNVGVFFNKTPVILFIIWYYVFRYDKGGQIMERMYKAPEVAKILNVTRQSIYRWIREGKLQAVEIGDSLRIRQSDLDNFIKPKEV